MVLEEDVGFSLNVIKTSRCVTMMDLDFGLIEQGISSVANFIVRLHLLLFIHVTVHVISMAY